MATTIPLGRRHTTRGDREREAVEQLRVFPKNGEYLSHLHRECAKQSVKSAKTRILWFRVVSQFLQSGYCMTALYVILFLSQMLYGFQLFSVSTYGFTVNDAVLCLFYLVIAKRLLWDGKPLSFPLSVPFFALIGLLVPVALSGFTPLWEGQGVVQFWKTTAHFLFGWFFAVIAMGLDEPPKRVAAVMRGFVIALGFIAAYGIYQVVARALDLPFAWLELNNVGLSLRKAVDSEVASQQLALKFSDFYRATSIFSEPSVLAGFTTNALVFLGIPYLQGSAMFLHSRVANWLLFIVYIGALFLTFSLTGLTGVTLVCALVFILERGKRIWKILYGLVIIVLCLSVIDIAVAPITKISILELFGKRLTGIVEHAINPYGEHTAGESFVSRSEAILIAADIWEDYPVLGTGLGRFSQAPAARKANILFSTSTYSSVLAEMGPLGFLLLVVFMASVAISTLYWYKRRDRLSPELRVVAGVIPYFYMLLVFLQFTGNAFVYSSLWQMFALSFFVINRARREQGLPFVELYLVRTPLRTVFARAITPPSNTAVQARSST